ncbi:MAG: hypothetical protein GKR96_11415 [Gammaproteobacteria bacterium]|nr:hypothetical protein [Gammaproteobacteria bacterium]
MGRKNKIKHNLERMSVEQIRAIFRDQYYGHQMVRSEGFSVLLNEYVRLRNAEQKRETKPSIQRRINPTRTAFIAGSLIAALVVIHL